MMILISFISCVLAVLIPAAILLSIYYVVAKFDLIKQYSMADGLFSILFLQALLLSPLYFLPLIKNFFGVL